MMKILKTGKQHAGLKLTADQWRRITLWLDLNANHLGWIGDDKKLIEAQRRGEDVWPPIDIDKNNPTGVENDIPLWSDSKAGHVKKKPKNGKKAG